MKRPIPDLENENSYKCPAGFEACNPSFFNQPEGHLHVVCKPIGSDTSKECPITSVKFKLTAEERNLYEWRASPSSTAKGIWISRKVIGQGIERLRIAPNQPCKDLKVYNPAPNEQFYFAEMARVHRHQSCIENSEYKLLENDLNLS